MLGLMERGCRDETTLLKGISHQRQLFSDSSLYGDSLNMAPAPRTLSKLLILLGKVLSS